MDVVKSIERKNAKIIFCVITMIIKIITIHQRLCLLTLSKKRLNTIFYLSRKLEAPNIPMSV